MSKALVIFNAFENKDLIFDVDASGGWDRVCMAVFLECVRAGAYGKSPGKRPQPPKKLDPADISDAKKVEAYGKKLRKYEHAFHTYDRRVEEWKLIDDAVAGDLYAARRVVEMLGPTFTHQTLATVPATVPRWTYPTHIQAANFASLLMQVMDDPFDPENAARLAKGPELIELYRSTTTMPPQPGYFDVPPAMGGGHDRAVILLMGAIRQLSEKGLHNLAAQDQTHRILEQAGVGYDVGKLTRQRIDRYGDVEKVALARFLDATDRMPTSHADRVRVDGFAKDTKFWLRQAG